MGEGLIIFPTPSSFCESNIYMHWVRAHTQYFMSFIIELVISDLDILQMQCISRALCQIQTSVIQKIKNICTL